MALIWLPKLTISAKQSSYTFGATFEYICDKFLLE